MEVSQLQAVQRFCRSVELCADCFRGYYGLKTVGDKRSTARGLATDMVTGDRSDLASTRLVGESQLRWRASPDAKNGRGFE